MDSNLVTASGKGLKEAMVEQIAYFDVNTRSAGNGDLSVKILGKSPPLPRGQLPRYRVPFTLLSPSVRALSEGSL